MPSDPSTTRRTLLRTVGVSTAAGLLAGCLGSAGSADPTASSTETVDPTTGTTGSSTETTSAPGADQTRIVRLGFEDEDPEIVPETATVEPGTTVRFVWESDDHSVVPTDQPADADWTGHEALEAEGFEYEHVFEVPGEYRFACKPHQALGAEATIRVAEPGQDAVSADPVPTDTVRVGPDSENVFAPGTDRPATASVGDEVTFVWESDAHNVVPTDQPADADWTGHEPVEDAGFEASFTFDVPGRYDFECQPHTSLGMTGTLLVEE